MAGLPGSTEWVIILIVFFVLFGAERLPKLARSMGLAKGEFQQGLKDATQLEGAESTAADLEAGGKTPEQVLADKAKDAGIDPTGKDTEELSKELEEKE